jgi:uncharacterized protein YkwD
MLAALVVAAAVQLTRPYDVAGAQAAVADVNARRTEAQLPPLVVDPQLTAIAMDRAADLIARHYFAHVSPDGTTIVDALRGRNLSWGYAGENLALAENVQAAESALWASPDHRDNILGAHYRRIGIAVVLEPGQGELVVQVFTG